ncbi:MAG: DUF4338 domain-containing protein [Candidatus Competibacteraceae bacterium]|nr:MAG: DUF4338 domain-containing protein [Candidatus Competibacteraceae bacterium]
MSNARQRNSESDLRVLLDEELRWASARCADEGQISAYEAAARVLLDLVRLGWRIREEGYGIELVAERPRLGRLTPEQILAEKRQTRELFRPIVEAQLSEPAVNELARRLENPLSRSGKKPIACLVADGGELHARLLAARQNPDGGDDPLATAVRPYLQWVTPDGIDEFTGHSLREIWRYFRFSWSIPQFATPGRQLLYLVRDAAHPCHAVMGIIGLNNGALQMGEDREYHLGWSLRALSERLCAADSPKCLAAEYEWMETQIAAAVDDVDPTALATPEELANPDREMIARLRRQAQEFDTLRDETLRELVRARSGGDVPILVAEMEDVSDDHPPVDEEMLRLELKPSANPTMQKARRHLVARKRAGLLAELLHARLTLREQRAALLDPSQIDAVLAREDVGIALQTVLAALKSRYAGINMLEISTCGAIPPYQHVLGGKLAALLLFSPQIADDYRNLYSGPSIISSQLKNAPVCRDGILVYLGTTSLYAQGSSQYERVSLPAGVISVQQAELRYRRIGFTSGYGTLQFLTETRKAVEGYLSQRREFRDVNSIFGEGPSPKLRRLVAGLRQLGFPPDTLTRHNRPRLIYAAELAKQARDFLNARSVALPDYLLRPQDFRDATERIAAFWRKRWLASRLSHVPSMNALLVGSLWQLSNHIPFTASASKSVREYDTPPQLELTEMKNGALEPDAFKFWRELAASGPKTTSDSMTSAELARIHVDLALEGFLAESIKNGISIFLTGNAGDGKTHLLRKLAPILQEYGAVVVEDATALMRRDQVAPIIDRWRKAVTMQVPFCIAINEYPLYLLRIAANSTLPIHATELDRQCRSRLVYGAESSNELMREKMLVIDLSLRNSLNREIVGQMLTKIVGDKELQTVPVESAPELARNLARLRDSRVQDRLIVIFERLSDMGFRATIREMWIILARMVLGYRSDSKTPLADGSAHWYSEIIFTDDSRFSLCRHLQLADPVRYSHPVWDSLLEDSDAIVTSGWQFDLPRPQLTPRLDRISFKILKRAFYFENENGKACFDLEDTDATEFRSLLRKHRDDDLLAVRQIIEAINRAYCPVSFPGCGDNLYLWNGHRFHEQPSRSFLANRNIPASELKLLRPRIPIRICSALPEFQPDHLLLRYVGQNSGVVSLRVDFSLYQTLQRLRRGLPRKLIPERDIFRLEAFLEALHPSTVTDRRVLSAHLERRELLEIQLSPDGKRYERITKY